MSDPDQQVGMTTYLGLFVITLATLMYEVLLTRIFSVSMWYHFAFMAISIAMFGMTAGAILVYVFPHFFIEAKAVRHLGLSALFFSLATVLSFLTQLSIPFIPEATFTGIFSIALTYLIISVPFIFSGVCVCLALTKFPRAVSKLYAADLAGAALGCFLIVYLLDLLDAPSAVILVAFLGGVGALLFLTKDKQTRLYKTAAVTSALLAAFFCVNNLTFYQRHPWVYLTWVKGVKVGVPPYQKWNSFSYICVKGDPFLDRYPFGWGLSETFPAEKKSRQLILLIDYLAGTGMIYYSGKPDQLEHLQYDIINLPHYLQKDADVLVIGAGGGRDVLSALAFNQKSVTAVEINPDILDTVNRVLGDFTGHLDKDPRVHFVVDEARSYVARSTQNFDLIQVSFIDTWAANANGAFVLTENSLYTVEAWELFLNHLTDRGVLSFSRWYTLPRPSEVYRLITLATTALTNIGVTNPREHIVVARLKQRSPEEKLGVGVILVKKTPFTPEEIEVLAEQCQRLKFEIMLSPQSNGDETAATLASGKDIQEFIENFPVNISPPTDNSPFFFNMLRIKDVFRPGNVSPGQNMNQNAVSILWLLLAIVIVLTLLGIIVPLALTTDKAGLRGNLPLFVFFAAIGIGFMLIEISQLQRLIIFLGHPIYGLAVVLFALLLSSGIGSATTQNIAEHSLARSAAGRLLALLIMLIIFGLSTHPIVKTGAAYTTPVRITLATLTIFPLGFFMGMAFPLGMKIAGRRAGDLTPWLWGINGATSVCASVVAVVIALYAGISAAFWTGFAFYLLAAVAFLVASRKKAPLETE